MTNPKVSEEENNRRMFCNNLDEPSSRWLLEHLTPEPPQVFVEPVRRPEPVGQPMTYVVLERDQAIPPGLQRAMARDAGITDLPSLDAGHDVMLSQPAALAALVAHYA